MTPASTYESFTKDGDAWPMNRLPPRILPRFPKIQVHWQPAAEAPSSDQAAIDALSMHFNLAMNIRFGAKQGQQQAGLTLPMQSA